MKCTIEKCPELASFTIPYNGKMIPVCGLNHYMVHVEREAQEYMVSIDKQRREGKKNGNGILAFRPSSSFPIAR